MTQDFLHLFGNFPLALLAGAVGIVALLALNTLFLVWLERKVAGRFQRRPGPTEMGPLGGFQTTIDMVKLLGKQLITPDAIDGPLYHLAPLVVFAPVVASVALLPMSEGTAIVDLDIGLVLVFTFGGVALIGIFMAGWGSNNKYALVGAMRAVAQNISYEIPLLLSALAVVMMTGTLSLQEITLAQGTLPFVLVQPVAALVYLVAATAETNRAPFDIPEAESELVAGFHTEYSGMRFAMFFFAEYSHVFVAAMVMTVLFLGGWQGPLLPGPVWFFAKTYAVVALMMWFRWTFPRLRFDQLMTFAWAILVPLAIANLLVTALVLKAL